jgi:hypothetical protein
MELLIYRTFVAYFVGYKMGNEVFRGMNPNSIYYTPPPLFSFKLKGELK